MRASSPRRLALARMAGSYNASTKSFPTYPHQQKKGTRRCPDFFPAGLAADLLFRCWLFEVDADTRVPETSIEAVRI